MNPNIHRIATCEETESHPMISSGCPVSHELLVPLGYSAAALWRTNELGYTGRECHEITDGQASIHERVYAHRYSPPEAELRPSPFPVHLVSTRHCDGASQEMVGGPTVATARIMDARNSMYSY